MDGWKWKGTSGQRRGPESETVQRGVVVHKYGEYGVRGGQKKKKKKQNPVGGWFDLCSVSSLLRVSGGW